MSKCSECRKFDALDTWQEKLASWFAWHITPKTIKDEIRAAHLSGFEQGYKFGREHEREIRTPRLDKLIRELRNK